MMSSKGVVPEGIAECGTRTLMWTAASAANGQKKSGMSPSRRKARDIDLTVQFVRSDTPFCGDASGTIFSYDSPFVLQ